MRPAQLPARIGRRSLLAGSIALPLLSVAEARTNSPIINVAGAAPSLRFRMTDADTGKPVTGQNFRGKIVMLYIGYTNCPDVCPLTLYNVTKILKRLGSKADDVRFLFVTVDPNRDTLPVLRHYTQLFAPQIIGLRGTQNELIRLARRFRLVYSVSPATATHPYEVTHAPSIYVFGPQGRAKLLIPSLYHATPADLAAAQVRLEQLLKETPTQVGKVETRHRS